MCSDPRARKTSRPCAASLAYSTASPTAGAKAAGRWRARSAHRASSRSRSCNAAGLMAQSMDSETYRQLRRPWPSCSQHRWHPATSLPPCPYRVAAAVAPSARRHRPPPPAPQPRRLRRWACLRQHTARVPRQNTRAACACRRSAAPNAGRPPSSARPSAEYQYRCPCGTAGQNPGDWPAPWRPATDALCTPALTARRAAHPAPAVPVRLLCAPTAPGKGRAPKTALMSTRLPPRAAGAHQSRRSLTRCRRWVCSGATASTSANPRARRAAGPPVPLRPARSYALSHGREGILSTNFLIQTANLFRTVVTVTTCRIFLFFSGVR